MTNQSNRPNQPPRRGPMGGHGPGGHMMQGGEKAKNFSVTIKRLLAYLKAVKIALLLVLAATIVSTIFSTVSPKILANAANSIQTTIMQRSIYEEIEKNLGSVPTNITGEQIYSMLPESITSGLAENMKEALFKVDFSKGKPGMDFDYIGGILLLCLALYAFSGIFGFVQSFVMAKIAQKTVYNMRNDVDVKLNRLPMKYFDTYTHGEILSRVTNDIDNVSNTLQQSLTQVISAVVTIISVTIMMLSISLILTLITICTLPLIIIITMFVAKRSKKQFKANQQELGNISGHVEEMYTGHKIISAYSHENISIEAFDDINVKLYNAGWKSQFISGLIMPLTNFLNNLGYLLICAVGGVLAINAKIGLGDIIAFTQYSRQFTQPIVQIANIINVLQSTAASAERVFEILDETEEVSDSKNSIELTNPHGAVSFEHVKFGYSDDKILIKDLNVEVKPGQTVAIVGPTGAGKTTLVNLLMRFYELIGGNIKIDGVNITDITRSDLRSLFGMVLQDTWLFNGTIHDNIGYGKDGSTQEQIISASKTSYVDRFVRTLSEGYDTVINEEASNLSQGQKQLLTIARAVLADPAILILDEATSSVDTRTEVLIQKAMNKLMVGRTSFVIAHRLSTIRNADLILVMNHGDIIEHGTHTSLMEQNGFYADLYNSQFAGKSDNIA
ncbi:MAG: ABC transporter ATP-binding protein [Oscillospiraceae bacterium]|nr:ABC transporter ATP-binding protein [Oscillospiraceae bacterium]